MQVGVQTCNFASKLAPIVAAVLKFPVHLIGLPANPCVIMTNLPARVISSEFPSHMSKHAIEVIDFRIKAVPPHGLIVGTIFGFVIVREKARAADA